MTERDAHGRYKPGISGNPKGRPHKGQTLTDALKCRVNKTVLADKLLELALGGNVAAVKYVYDRIDGFPRQTVETNAPLIGQLAELWAAIGNSSEPETESDPE